MDTGAKVRSCARRKMAERIQARAIRRCGELLRQVPPSAGGRPPETRDATVPSSRQQVATDAGLSEHQRKTALRVAAVPEAVFEAQVESEAPPTLNTYAKVQRCPRRRTWQRQGCAGQPTMKPKMD